MPPKEKPKGAQVDPAEAAAAEKALMESELVMAVLRTRLGRYQAAGEKLAVENFSLTDEVAKQKLTLQDINEFLTNELKARSLAAAQLEERVGQLNTRLIEVQKEAQAEIARVKAEAAAEVAAASSRAAAAAGAAGGDAAAAGEGGTADLAGQRAQLERTVAELNAALSARQREFDARFSDMERRHLQDKEKMRKEATTKIRETKLAMAQLADQHLESSTKRTLVENETMVAELAYHTAQSHDLVAANGVLRSEAAELRRQLAIAHKTVQSTAHKNLLLQQTIKSILTCLREEARHNAEAAAVATPAAASAGQHQQQHQHDSPGSAAAAAGMHQCQHHHVPEQGMEEHPEGVEAGSSSSCADQLLGQQRQQQRQDGSSSSSVSSVLQQLEDRVVSLSLDLSAAKQALAAALQGCLPQDMQFACSVVSSTGACPAAPTAMPAQPHSVTCPHAVAAGPGSQHQHDSTGCCGSSAAAAQSKEQQAGGSSSSCVSPQRSRGPSPVAGQRQQQSRQRQHNQPQQQVVDTALEDALTDGVAAFVLYCVQQLRRGGGSAGGSAMQQATRASTAAAAAAAGVSTRNTAAGSRGGLSTPKQGGSSGSRCGSPGGAAGYAGSRGVQAAAAAQAAGVAAGGTDAPAAHAAAAAATELSGCGEQLARLLLEQLHAYSRQHLVPYAGMSVSFGSGEQSAGGGCGCGDAVGQEGMMQQQQQQCDVSQWPAVPLLAAGGGECGASGAAGVGVGGVLGVGQLDCSNSSTSPTPLSLPPLPCLLHNMGRRQHAAAAAGAFEQQQQQQQCLPADGGAGGGGAGSGAGSPAALASPPAVGRAAARNSVGRADMFDAVLSDLRPWGGGGGGVGAGGGGAGALSPSSGGSPTASIGGRGGSQLRSRTPTSPATSGSNRGHLLAMKKV